MPKNTLLAVTSTIVRTPKGEILEVGIMGAEGFVGLSRLYGVRLSDEDLVDTGKTANAPAHSILIKGEKQ